MRLVMAIVLSVAVMVVPIVSAQQRPVSIRYLGWSFFLITAADGLRLAIDPYGNIGYPLPSVEADVVLVTHEHGDHNNVGLIGGSPQVFRGLAPGARDWNRVYQRLGGTLIYAVPGFHDNEFGTTPRGLDTFFVIESGGLRIAHLGDIGQSTLSESQLRALRTIDVLMIPVGAGPFTVSVADANRLVDQIRPRIVIPMHYKTPMRQPPTWPGVDERPFLEGKPNVRRLGHHTLTLTPDDLPPTMQVVVMEWQ
ncbi:MAG: MBL fold metallo-hydrolase [Armatimonadota bacterium]|nr:MBL fold metallo-hydrolase [Armatimonadota bacterium]MDR7548944.1 MBL fold metallo-hydrolase [Armatimonadota bacterium]